MEYLEEQLGDVSFDQLRIPLALVTADLNHWDKVVLSEGSVLEAVRATMTVPGLFAPVERGEQILVDGGLVDNLAAGVVREMGADVVVAVDVTTSPEAIVPVVEELRRRPLLPEPLVDMADVVWRAIVLLVWEVNRRVLEENPPDLLIVPDLPQGITVVSGFGRVREAVAAGERAAEEAMPRLRELLAA
jgi:NTE family protein